jgi:hypothetical protein
VGHDPDIEKGQPKGTLVTLPGPLRVSPGAAYSTTRRDCIRWIPRVPAESFPGIPGTPPLVAFVAVRAGPLTKAGLTFLTYISVPAARSYYTEQLLPAKPSTKRPFCSQPN